MFIYKITNIVNNKIYIGKTIKLVEDRFIEHGRQALQYDSKYAIHRAIRKYGIENFKIEKICKCKNVKGLNKMEIYFIKKFDSMNPKLGYNMTIGGEGGTQSEEVRKRISIGIKLFNKNNPQFGKATSERMKKNNPSQKEGIKIIPWNLGLGKDDPRVKLNIDRMLKTINKRKNERNKAA